MRKELYSAFARRFARILPPPASRRALEALYAPRRPDLALRLEMASRSARHVPRTLSPEGTVLVDRIVSRDPGEPGLGDTVATASFRGPATEHVAAMLGFERCVYRPSLREAARADALFQWGVSPSFSKARLATLANELHVPMLYCEDGVLLRSVGIGLSGAPCLAVCVDDTTAYYDATRRSRLERLLSNPDRVSEATRDRARHGIDEMRRRRLSKYNHAPDTRASLGPAHRSKILLVDQRRDDASVAFGRAQAQDFEHMLAFAVRQWPNHQLLLKRHPDQISAGRRGYFDDRLLRRFDHAASRMTIVDEELNPHTLFDQVEAVCCVTSGMGFEALLAGLPVYCFGSPFYAGWGVTTDARPTPRRRPHAGLDIASMFAILAFDSHVYFDPKRGSVVSYEDHLNRLAAERDRTR